MNNLDLHSDLSFLEFLTGDRGSQYKSAKFLKSDFNSNIWTCEFGKHGKIELNWNLEIYDGSLLTSNRHRLYQQDDETGLLTIFKHWITLQDHTDVSDSGTVSDKTLIDRVRCVLHLIDYLLLNGQDFDLATFGLKNITESDMIRLLAGLSSENEIVQSIYGWRNRLTNWFRYKINTRHLSSLNELIDKNPILSDVDLPQQDWLLELSKNEVIYARTILWELDWYESARIGDNDYKFKPRLIKVINDIYKNTLYGVSQKPIPWELALESRDGCSRELQGAPTRLNQDRSGEPMSSMRFSCYVKTVRTLGLLQEIDLPVSKSIFTALQQKLVISEFGLSPVGRVRTLPQPLVFDSSKHAVEFVNNYGKDLVESTLKLATAAAKKEMTIQKFSNVYSIDRYLTPKIKALGVRYWSIGYLFSSFGSKTNIVTEFNKDTYFTMFRENNGLWELIRVLYGSVQVFTGTLMARRLSELMELEPNNCLDENKRYLIFNNRKSGIFELRNREARPIHQEAVEMIELLIQLQQGLIDSGHTEAGYLFAYPSTTGRLVGLRHPQYNRTLDYFCDYFQLEKDKNGCRYYIRQHQLRRFFAMLFFWGRSFGGMDTLRWFMGHTDIKHLYRYISEEIPGKVLRGVKAQFTTDAIRAPEKVDNEAAIISSKLADLLEKKFHTRNFYLLDSEELEMQIEEWLDEGLVVVEPEFFRTSEGNDYRILVQVKGQKE